MIEVNLVAIPSDDPRSRVGKCVARNRFDKEAMGVTVENFVKGFLKDNLDKFEAGIGTPELTEIINSAQNLTRHDLASINYYLGTAGFKVVIFNVADDEDNAVTVPSGIVEWNVIDSNFVQYDYPTAVKIIPGQGMEIPSVLKQVVENSNLFAEGKFSGLKNPFTDLIKNLEKVKEVMGSVSAALTTKIYDLLDEMGIEVFCMTSED